MAQFNFLSGSSIDNYTEFLFDAFLSESTYLGFSRGTPDNQWGVNSLIYITHDGNPFIDNIAKAGDPTNATKFFDFNSLDYVSGASNLNQNRRIYMKKYANNDTTFTNNLLDNTALDLSNLTLSYMGEYWIMIKGLPTNWYEYLTPSTTASYYITNYTESISNVRVKINLKSGVSVPYYNTNCKLLMSEGGTGTPVVVKEGLQRTANILGENFITGMTIDGIFAEDTEANKTTIKNATFTITDTSSPNGVLYDNLIFVDPNIGDDVVIYEEVVGYGNSKKYLTFQYTYTENEYQYIQLIIGSNQADELGIWTDGLPYTSVHPVADANPPALDVSYLKNLSLSNSLFDMNGLIKISAASGEVEFVKEIFSTATSAEYIGYGFDIEVIDMVGENVNHLGFVSTAISAVQPTDKIYMQDFHTFIVGDVVQIPQYPALYLTDQSTPVSAYIITDIDNTPANGFIQLNTNVVLGANQVLPVNYELTSNATNVTARMMLAKTTDKDLALRYGFYNVLISKTVPLFAADGSPTENIYRQLSIMYKPKDSSDVLCSNDVYNGDTTFGNANFNTSTWKYNNGIVLYIANKIPVFRKWANQNEQFKIII